MSFLAKISNLRKSNPVVPPKASSPNSQSVTYQAPSLLPQSYTRKEDPAVRRLKEKRQQELLRKGELSKKVNVSKKASEQRKPKRKDPDDENSTVTRFKKKSSGNVNRATHISVAQAKKKPEPIKKMSFEELMKQADTNATSKGRNTKKDTPTHPRISSKAQSSHISKPRFKKTDRPRKANPEQSVRIKPAAKGPPVSEEKRPRLPQISSGFAKPNEAIRRRLEAKKKAAKAARKTEMDDYGSDMDDFIDDNEEEILEEQGPGYDRDEIWALFNRGKRRSDYAFDDDDEDDMEANEMEIIEEEERARKMARLEDKREEEWLRKHDMQKKKRKKGKG